MTTTVLTVNVPNGENSMEIDLSRVKDGVNIVSLYVDGSITDSKSFTK